MCETTSGADDSAPADREVIIERVRAGCLAAARAAYEDAGVRGLCEEGRWECALDAMCALKFDHKTGVVRS